MIKLINFLFGVKKIKTKNKKESVLDRVNKNGKMDAALFLLENGMQEEGVKLIKEINDNS
jgi:hypothetical protein